MQASNQINNKSGVRDCPRTEQKTVQSDRFNGLTEEEVQERRARGDGGFKANPVTKTRRQIFRENIFTLFNLLNFIIAVLLFSAGAYSNLLFIGIILLNIVIGIAQELKAKKLVDELSVLNRPMARVMRGGKAAIVETGEVVRDDVMILEGGQQICNDAVVLDGPIEVNESLLTGESDAVLKNTGEPLFSGSFVISGKCHARVTHVGQENYAVRLTEEAKKEKQSASELLGSMEKVTKFTSFLIVPLGILLFVEAVWLRNASAGTAVVSSAAALLGMLPKGLVLLIAVSLAAGVIRLARMKILVQNIYSLETLAHVDVLCLEGR
ncbi:MAG: HAD-IC family P-type ATPase [Eubacteriaceae bacterium]|jgi:cation-transporting ATPase E